MGKGKLSAVQVNMAWLGAAMVTFSGGSVIVGGAEEKGCLLIQSIIKCIHQCKKGTLIDYELRLVDKHKY